MTQQVPHGGRTALQLLAAGCPRATVVRFLTVELDLRKPDLDDAMRWAAARASSRRPHEREGRRLERHALRASWSPTPVG